MAHPLRGTRFSRARSVLGAAACVTTVSLVSGVVSPAASGQSSTSAVGELVTAVSRAQADVDARNLDLGSLQESVNQSLVDLHDAQAKAEQARRGEEEAKRRLAEAQANVEKLRAELDDLSRAQYRGAAASDALLAMSGKRSQDDVLDRSTFLRQRAEEKRAKLDEAERARAETANEESTLRQASELADQTAEEAKSAEAKARQLLDDNRAALNASTAERDAAQQKLDEAKAALDKEHPAKAEAAPVAAGEAKPTADKQPEPAQQPNPEQPAQSGVAATPYAATLTISNGETTYEVPEEVVDLVRKRVADTAPESPEPSRDAIVDAVKTVAQTSSDGDLAALSSAGGTIANIDSDTIAKAGAIAAGVALVGNVAAKHGSFDNSNVDAAEIVTAFADGLTGALGKVDSTADTVSAVLPESKTAEDVSAKAQKTVAKISDSSQVEAVIARAQSAIGTPYVWGGE